MTPLDHLEIATDPHVRGHPPRSRCAGLLAREKCRESTVPVHFRHIRIVVDEVFGSFLRDLDENVFTGSLSGPGVLSSGCDRPELVRAVADSLSRFSRGPDLPGPAKEVFIAAQSSLLATMSKKGTRTHFCGPTGATAVDAAIELCGSVTARGDVASSRCGFHRAAHVGTALTALVPGARPLPFPNCTGCPMGLIRGTRATHCIGLLERSLRDPDPSITLPTAAMLEMVRRLRALTGELDIPGPTAGIPDAGSRPPRRRRPGPRPSGRRGDNPTATRGTDPTRRVSAPWPPVAPRTTLESGRTAHRWCAAEVDQSEEEREFAARWGRTVVPIISVPQDFNEERLYVDLEPFVGHELYLKCEGFNFAGSIKLKAATAMVEAAENEGLLRPGSILIESSSGNLGVALSMIAANRGYRFVCVTDSRCNLATRRLMEALGSEVHVITEPNAGGFLGARLDHVRALCAADGRYLWLNQYANPNAWMAHFRSTAPGIAEEFPAARRVVRGGGHHGNADGLRALVPPVPAARPRGGDRRGRLGDLRRSPWPPDDSRPGHERRPGDASTGPTSRRSSSSRRATPSWPATGWPRAGSCSAAPPARS